MMLAYGNVWFFNLDEVSFLYPTNPLKNMHDVIKINQNSIVESRHYIDAIQRLCYGVIR